MLLLNSFDLDKDQINILNYNSKLFVYSSWKLKEVVSYCILTILI